MKIIKILRVENQNDGCGIFRSCYKEAWQVHNRISERHREFPTPYEDEDLDLDQDDKEWFCAYKTIEQFQEWVESDEIEALIESGFDVLLLEVSEYQIGGHQVLFTKESIVKETIINDLFRNGTRTETTSTENG